MTTKKSYDFLNRLQSISSSNSALPSPISFSYAYNSANQRTRRTEADASYWRYDYDPLGQVKSGKKYWSDETPTAGQQFEYAFDDIGNRTTTKSGGDENGWNLRSASYSVNNLNQYTSRDVPGYVDIMGQAFATSSVTVSAISAYRKGEYFRKELSVSNSSTNLWTNIITAATGQTSVTGNVLVAKTPENFTYDYDGNLTSDGSWNYTWDGENRLIQITANTGTGPQQLLKFEYDSKGRRIRKQVWNNTAGSGSPALDIRFLYDAWNLIATLSTNSQLQSSYTWGLDLSGSLQGAGGVGGLLWVYDQSTISNSPSTHFAAFDGNGNVAALLKTSDGTASARYEYSPFDQLLRATGPMVKANPLRFSSKYQDDETDALYYGYRYYSGSSGRWMRRDPIEEHAGGNLYGFVANNPLHKYDPLGKEQRDFNYQGYSFTVDIDVFQSWAELCNSIFAPELLIPVTLTTKDMEGKDAAWAQDNVLLTFDDVPESFTVNIAANVVFNAIHVIDFPVCPKGPQHGSTTFKGQFHDDLHVTDWVTGVTVVIEWTYECSACCTVKKPLLVKLTWTPDN